MKNFLKAFLSFLLFYPLNSFSLESFIIEPNSVWHFHTKKFVEKDWKEPEFSDHSWDQGNSGFGYGDGDDVTILHDMAGNYTRVQIRKSFAIDRNLPEVIYLYIRFDDAFIAYINGKEVCRSPNIVGDQVTQQHEAKFFEEYPLLVKGLLSEGSNIIAIEGLNQRVSSSDFTLDPYLRWERRTDKITKKEMIEDLNFLSKKLTDSSSYIRKGKMSSLQKIENIKNELPKTLSMNSFLFRIKHLMAPIGDGHGRVRRTKNRSHKELYLPFRIGWPGAGFCAVALNGKEFLSQSYPFLHRLEGLTVQMWLDAAKKYENIGSSSQNLYRSMVGMSRIDVLRRDMNLPSSSSISVTLADLEGNTIDLNLIASRKRYPLASVSFSPTQIIGNIGYLRIPKMKDYPTEKIQKNMLRFQNTSALIIDVRDNGGGKYQILGDLLGYFLPQDSSPLVANIATYMKNPIFGRNHLHYRPTYRESWSGWDKEDLVAIKEAKRKFKPEWKPPEDLFSQWHYMIIKKKHFQYYYNKPVIVLSSIACFSATDLFLSTFSLLPQVTLIGQASRGGSGASRSFFLPRSEIAVRLSSMASFRPSGKMFDGQGVEVDIALEPKPTDLIDKGDYVLKQAMEMVYGINNNVELSQKP